MAAVTKFPVESFASMKTPFYYYDMDLLRSTLEAVRSHVLANPEFCVHYALKANPNPVILKMIADFGLGADCVSGGEVQAAVEAGFSPDKIVYAGVGKTDDEIRLALGHGIARFNVESKAELEVISALACECGKVARISIRVNPDIGAHTHANITTGLAENKFGINLEQLGDVVDLAHSLPGVEYKGLHFHIGSQILDMADFVALCNRINELKERFERAGKRIGDINVGGGLGIDYQDPDAAPVPDFDAYFDVFRKHLRLDAGTQLHFELGRSIVAQCGSLVCRVLYIKEGTTRTFAIVDGSMTELVRPAMYHASHKIQNISNPGGELCQYDVVGPVCESSDVFGKGVSMARSKRGDFVALRSAGAYGEAMSSCYNLRPLPQSVFSKK